MDKHRYKQLIKSDFQDMLPNLDPDVIDDRAQYILNMLINEAPNVRGRKNKQTGTLKKKKKKKKKKEL